MPPHKNSNWSDDTAFDTSSIAFMVLLAAMLGGVVVMTLVLVHLLLQARRRRRAIRLNAERALGGWNEALRKGQRLEVPLGDRPSVERILDQLEQACRFDVRKIQG